MTIEEYKRSLQLNFPIEARKLKDSPKSLLGKVRETIGFYRGLCYGVGVNPDLEFIQFLESFAPRD